LYVNSIPWEEPTLRLYPLSDVHWPKHEHGLLEDWLEIVNADEHALVTLGGDMFDAERTHARTHLKSYTDDTNSWDRYDEAIQGDIDAFAEFLTPIGSKIVGSCSGNHFHLFPDGQISDQKLTLLLNPKAWMGVAGFVVVDINGYKLKILLHHNAGRNGGTPGADFNAFLRAAQNVEADIIVLGHTHRLMNVPGSTKITVDDDNTIGAHQTIFVRSGSYMKRYSDEKPGSRSGPFTPDYGEEKLFAPSTFGHASVEVKIVRGRPVYNLTTAVR